MDGASVAACAVTSIHRDINIELLEIGNTLVLLN